MSVLPLDLVNGDVQCSVGPLAHRQGLVDPELSRSHCLTLRQRCQVETKLLPVGTRLQEVPLLLHCRGGAKTGQRSPDAHKEQTQRGVLARLR